MGKQFTPSLIPNQLSLHLLIALAITNFRLMSTTDSLPPPPPSTVKSSPSPPAATIRSQQFYNIIDALIGTGDFSSWINILSNADPSKLPPTATLFIPANTAVTHLPELTASGLNFDRFIIPYHIVPKRFSFADLQRLKSQTRLATLLPNKTLIITNNSPSNFSIDNTRIIEPDIYVTTNVCAHGVEGILDYAVYGNNRAIPSPSPPPAKTVSPAFVEVTSRGRSDAACICTEFPIVIWGLWIAFALKVNRNILTR